MRWYAAYLNACVLREQLAHADAAPGPADAMSSIITSSKLRAMESEREFAALLQAGGWNTEQVRPRP